MTRKRFWVLLAVLILAGSGLGLCVGVYAPVYWQACAEARKASRFEALAALRAVLQRYAWEHGQYPDRFEDAVEEVDVMPPLRLDDLEYDASGMSYAHEGNFVLFHEKTAKRYGSVVGWFVMDEDSWGFNAGQPPQD